MSYPELADVKKLFKPEDGTPVMCVCQRTCLVGFVRCPYTTFGISPAAQEITKSERMVAYSAADAETVTRHLVSMVPSTRCEDYRKTSLHR